MPGTIETILAVLPGLLVSGQDGDVRPGTSLV